MTPMFGSDQVPQGLAGNPSGSDEQERVTGDTPEVQPGTSLGTLSEEDRAALLAEFQALQKKIAAQVPQGLAGNPSAEQVAEERMQHPYYCPGCGKVANFMKECNGTATAPHAPIEVVSTSELGGDPSQHTKAPDSVLI